MRPTGTLDILAPTPCRSVVHSASARRTSRGGRLLCGRRLLDSGRASSDKCDIPRCFSVRIVASRRVNSAYLRNGSLQEREPGDWGTCSELKANRLNAARSTGPRTERGKGRSSRNALRHGLATPVAVLPVYYGAVEDISRLLAGADADDRRRELARPIAEAQVDLCRIRAAKIAVLEQLHEALGSPLIGEPTNGEVAPAGRLFQELARLDRYERRTLSRRKFAIRTPGAAGEPE